MKKYEFTGVQKTHGDNEHGKVYMLAIEMAKLRIKFPEESEDEQHDQQD